MFITAKSRRPQEHKLHTCYCTEYMQMMGKSTAGLAILLMVITCQVAEPYCSPRSRAFGMCKDDDPASGM